MKKMLLVVVLVLLVVLSACTKSDLKAKTGISWQDAVKYHVGGSGEVDPAAVFSTNRTAVDHDSRFIVDNEKLDPMGCFPVIDDAGWKKLTNWSAQWIGPTRIEWQVAESRCSWVFPGNITDAITEQDYKDVLDILASYGYTQTWFVGGDEGSEFGKATYQEIMASDSSFNRLHVYGPALAAMPELASPEAPAK